MRPLGAPVEDNTPTFWALGPNGRFFLDRSMTPRTKSLAVDITQPMAVILRAAKKALR